MKSPPNTTPPPPPPPPPPPYHRTHPFISFPFFSPLFRRPSRNWSGRKRREKIIWFAIRLSLVMNNLMDILLNLIVLYYCGHWRRTKRPPPPLRTIQFPKASQSLPRPRPVGCNYPWPWQTHVSESGVYGLPTRLGAARLGAAVLRRPSRRYCDRSAAEPT